MNYKSHLGDRTPPTSPEMFYKAITSLQNPDDTIAIPRVSKNTHYEGELALAIGKRASRSSVIFAVTCGNDVSECDWRGGPQKDLQWWRAKGDDRSDRWAP